MEDDFGFIKCAECNDIIVLDGPLQGKAFSTMIGLVCKDCYVQYLEDMDQDHWREDLEDDDCDPYPEE